MGQIGRGLLHVLPTTEIDLAAPEAHLPFRNGSSGKGLLLTRSAGFARQTCEDVPLKFSLVIEDIPCCKFIFLLVLFLFNYYFAYCAITLPWEALA